MRRHDVDAAVMFADIMLPLLGMGVDVELVENVGPVIERPIRDAPRTSSGSPCPSRRSRCADPRGGAHRARASCAPDQAVIGFCGGPFTVAGYLIEGKPSREFLNVKGLMYARAATWHALMEKLADTFAALRRGEGARPART